MFTAAAAAAATASAFDDSRANILAMEKDSLAAAATLARSTLSRLTDVQSPASSILRSGEHNGPMIESKNVTSPIDKWRERERERESKAYREMDKREKANSYKDS